MNRELSFSDVGIGQANSKILDVSRPLTAPPLMMNVKMEGLVAEKESGISVDLSFTPRTVYKQQ